MSAVFYGIFVLFVAVNALPVLPVAPVPAVTAKPVPAVTAKPVPAVTAKPVPPVPAITATPAKPVPPVTSAVTTTEAPKQKPTTTTQKPVPITTTQPAFTLDLTTVKITDVQAAIKQGQVTCRQVVQGFLDRIAKYNATIGAVVSTNPNALQEAGALDDYFKANKQLKGPLHCATLVAKDAIDVAGIATTAGLNVFRGQVPLKDATVVKNCKDQGAIFIGKANMSPLSDKEAWGHSETGGLIRNPYGVNYTTYGSSGGNSAAANARLAIGGIGTETGVSINLPSSTGNLVGLRPPVALLDACKCRDGVMPNSHFQDVVGPMARYAEDALLIFEGMIGQRGTYSSKAMDVKGLANLKVNIFEMMAYESWPLGPAMYQVDPKIMQLFSAAAQNMISAGAQVKNVSVNFNTAAPSIMAMFTTGYSSCIPGWRDAYFGDNTRFGKGMFHSSAEVIASNKLPAYYQSIWQDLQNQSTVSGLCVNQSAAFLAAKDALIKNGINAILGDADIAIWPTLPVFPAALGDDAFAMNWGSSVQAPINLVLLASWSGYPSITVPLGFSDPTTDTPQGLPIGLHMMTSPDKLPQLLKAAYAFQKNYGIWKFPVNFK